MESNRKRRSANFMKAKLMPFYRSPKSSSTTTATNVNQYSTKGIKPAGQSKPGQSSTSNAYVVHHQQLHRKDYIIAPPKQPPPQKVSFVLPAAENNSRADKLLTQLDKLYGISVDESIDIRAATYISSVQERFKLERSISERVTCEDNK